MDLKLLQVDNDKRIRILEKLGYKIDSEGYLIERNKKRVICRYSDKHIHISHAAILPGSAIVINANPITLSQYFVEYGNNE